MTISRARVTDSIESVASYNRDPSTGLYIVGTGSFILWDENGEIKQQGEFKNLVTAFGNEYYTRRAANISAPAIITGMQLGTGTTAPASTGAGAAIVTLVANSLVAIDGGFPTFHTGDAGQAANSGRVKYKVTWAAGTATANSIAEVVLTNQSTGTQTAAPAGSTISRALLSPTVNKAAGDTLAVTWNHDLLGS